jgi:predicted 3-demethylubiquinone-9 3-methyltransferase (glyoxalase superfamily)
MTQKITPFLWFDNQAEEAANFYCSIFKDSKITNISRYTEVGPGPAGTVMVVAFTLNGQEFAGINGGPIFKFTEAISFQIDCADQAEVDFYWDKLLEGGGEPSQCAWLKDKYGLSWQVVPKRLMELLGDPDLEKSNRVMQAMLQMSKIEVAKLEEAAAAG